jgi:hypothetical protein
MINSDTKKVSEGKKNDESKKAISNEDVYRKLLELEERLKMMEKRISKPLIG